MKKKFAHIKIRNPLLSGALKFKATKRYAYRNGVLTDITNGEPDIKEMNHDTLTSFTYPRVGLTPEDVIEMCKEKP